MKLKAIFLAVWVGFSIQPAFSQVEKIVAGTPLERAAYGYDVSQDGDYLIVGAKDESVNDVKAGAVYIYHLEEDVWVEQIRLTPENPNDGEFFGISVGISGEYALIGANGNDDNGTNSGAAYIYKRVGSFWELHQTLSPQTLQAFDEFGISVDLSGNIAVIGAYSDATNGLFAGAAYVYELLGNTWEETAKLIPEEVEAQDKFGRSVDTDGRKIIVCRVLADEQGTDSGAAYIFSKNENDLWTEEAKLLAPDGTNDDRFGRSVGISYDHAAVGAVLDDDNGNNSGSAYIFKRTAEGWTFEDKVTPADGAAEDFFGYSLSITPAYLVVGALNKDGIGANTGAAYLFSQSGSSWIETQKFTAFDETELAGFGEAVDINGQWLTIGAPFWGEEGSSTGAVYVQPAPTPLGLTPKHEEGTFSIYPNPASGEINIKVPNNNGASYNVEIYNSLGITIKSILFPKGEGFRFSVDELPQGVYHVILRDGTRLWMQEFIVQ